MNTPTIAGDWWTIAGVPDLGRYNTHTIEPMDFSVWQAPYVYLTSLRPDLQGIRLANLKWK